jgi:hypothetical protein
MTNLDHEQKEQVGQPDQRSPEFIARARKIALEAVGADHHALEVDGTTAFRLALNPTAARLR